MFLEQTSRKNQSGEGWIEVICGSMFSGKTEELLRRINRARIARQEIKIFKPIVDVRYHEEDVVSHDKRAILSTPVSSAAEILDIVGEEEVVGIDEAQFFDMELPDVCNELANRGIRVIVAGLDMDFKGKPFGPMPYLMAIAEYVTKVHAICVKTGKLANFSHRITENSELIELGESAHYEPLSRKAFLEIQKTKDRKDA